MPPAGTAPAAATTTTTPDQPASSAAQVQDIVVTAQRRSENLQRVPIAVTTFNQAALANAAIRSTSQLTTITPALTLSNVAGFVEPRIRGIGNAAAGPGVENSIATYVDGVYLSSAPGSATALSSVERVEVLKGPQGTLFGRNATGGLLQIITKDPGDTFGGTADIGYGSFETLTGDLYLTAPISDSTGINFAGSVTHMGSGYGKSLTSGQDIYRTEHDVSLRSKLVSHVTDTTTIRISADYDNLMSSDPPPVAYSGTATTSYTSGGVPVRLYNSPWDSQTNGYINHRVETGGGSVKVDQALGALTLSSITAFRSTRFHQLFDADFSPAPAIYESYIQKDDQLSQELQLGGKSGRLRWVIGGYYFRLISRYEPFELFFGLPPAQHDTVLQDRSFTQSFAGYGQATWAVTDNTNLTGGFRYTVDQRSLTASSTAIAATGASTVTDIPFARVTYRTPTWRLSLDHNFTRDIMAYVSWNRGYKSGGYNAQSPTAPAYDPEKLDAYEVGVKSLLFGRKLRLNVAGFYYDYKNIQVNTYIGTLGVIYNGAKAQIYGIDADLDLAATTRLHFNGGIVAMHDRFTSFPDAQVASALGNGLWAIGPASATGNRLPFAPDVNVSAGMTYTFPLDGRSATLSLNDLHSTGYATQPDNVLKQGAYDQLGVSASWKLTPAVTVRAFASNLLNDAVAIYLAASTSGTGVSYQPPRTFGAEVGVKF